MITQISEKKFPLICPLENCKREIYSSDMKKLLNREEYEKSEKF